MKEIKFRAWDVINKKMYPVAFPTWNGSVEGKIDFVNHTVEEIEQEGDDRAIVMQFTGKKDKNLKDIYEGDILKSHGQVIWNQDEYRWSCIDLTWNDKREWHDFDYLTSEFEVIGNIYENPDLLTHKPI